MGSQDLKASERKVEPVEQDSLEEDSGDERSEATEDIKDESDTECRPIEFGAKSSQRVEAVVR